MVYVDRYQKREDGQRGVSPAHSQAGMLDILATLMIVVSADTIIQIAESDFAAQARIHAAQLGQNLQTGARGAAESFNRFVEGPDEGGGSAARRRVEPERKDFWDDFSSIAAQENRKSTSGAIGTAAMKKGPSSSTPSGFGGGSTANKNNTTSSSGKDEWTDDW